jgi:glycosyltransferase 2 family protein
MKWLNKHHWIKQAATLLLITVPLLFLLANLTKNWQALLSFEWEFDLLRSFGAILCLVAAFGLLPVASQQSLRGLGYRLDYKAAYHGFFIAQLAKYLPGGFWVIPGRILAFKKYNVGIAVSSISVVIELLLLVVAGSLIFVPYLFFADIEIGRGTVWLILGATMLLLAALYPPIFNTGLRYLLIPMGYEYKDFSLDVWQLLQILATFILFWIMAGIGFYFLATTVQQASTIQWFLFIPIYSIAWIIGFLAFLTPGGLGVREGALAMLLSPFLPPPLPSVIALLARLWWTVAELISVLLAVVIDRGNSATEAKT